MRTLTLPLLALAMLTACDSGTPGADETVTPAATETASPAPTPAATPTATEIPMAARGRWGMVPADCEPGRADAKGLLTIDATTLEFYESVGTLGEIEEASATRIRADFDFTGEGMTWERDVLLDVQDDGATLIRREFGADAEPGPFRYAKCN